MKLRECRIVSTSPEDTHRFGAFLGRHLTGGTVVTLDGKLGSGKTCLTQGIAAGLGVPEHFYVTSPTFSLVNEYPGRIPLFHADLYRLSELEELEDIGFDEILSGRGITVVEWAERFSEAMPTERLAVSISIVEEQIRHFCLTAFGTHATELIRMCAGYDKDN